MNEACFFFVLFFLIFFLKNRKSFFLLGESQLKRVGGEGR